MVGIQLLSRLIHHYIPSHVVGCDHTHDEVDEAGSDSHSHRDQDSTYGSGHCHEDTPLLQRPAGCEAWENSLEGDEAELTYDTMLRPSLQTRLTRQVTNLVSGRRALCDGDGPCYGYSEPCGQECFKVRSRSPSKIVARRSVSGPAPLQVDHERPAGHSKPPVAQDVQGYLDPGPLHSTRHSSDAIHPAGRRTELPNDHNAPNSLQLYGATRKSNLDLEHGNGHLKPPISAASQGHHHHVHSNAFLSIGLQTSTAIALHKLPEGFITFATNHANPTLGFAVFLALFIHNITEGFAMALPLFLAFNSRLKAILWSSLLGGVSQPLGAGIAALWLQTAGDHDMAPGERVYGAMFAVTSGIMTSVALQLFAESLALTHKKTWCTAWAFLGMGILGLSFALTA